MLTRARGGRAASILSHAWLAAAVSAALAGCGKPPTKPPAPGPAEVVVESPTEGVVTDFEDFTGRTDAVKTVEVRARVSGYLEAIGFEDGTEVKEGDVLFEIDDRQYKAEVERAEAEVAQAQAHEDRLGADYRRATGLFTRGALSREELDKTSGDLAEAKAAVGISRAKLDLARLNLDYTRVVAPVSGRISRRMVDVGNLIQADSTPMTTIVTLDPMYVYFDVDERTLLRIRRLIREGKVKSYREGSLSVMAALADEEEFPHQGRVDFADNRIDPTTGTLRVRAVFDNPVLREVTSQVVQRIMSPGLFVRVRLPIGSPHPALLVAEKAIGSDQGRKFVYVVGEDGKVERRPITVGTREGDRRVVESGLSKGEQIVVEGLQRIRPGAKVVAKAAGVTPEPKGETPKKLARSDGSSRVPGG